MKFPTVKFTTANLTWCEIPPPLVVVGHDRSNLFSWAAVVGWEEPPGTVFFERVVFA